MIAWVAGVGLHHDSRSIIMAGESAPGRFAQLKSMNLRQDDCLGGWVNFQIFIIRCAEVSLLGFSLLIFLSLRARLTGSRTLGSKILTALHSDKMIAWVAGWGCTMTADQSSWQGKVSQEDSHS